MADTTINPPSSSLKRYYRVARFAWENGKQYLVFTSNHYFSPPSSHIYETCENFLCWETEWIALPVHRTAVEASSINQLLGARPELVLFDDVVEETTQQEEAPPLFETCTSIWHTAISSSRVQEAVNVQVSRIISKIDSKRSCSFDIDWSSSTGVPLLSVTDFSTGQAYYGQADNFCEIYKGISPEMLYFYSTADEEF